MATALDLDPRRRLWRSDERTEAINLIKRDQNERIRTLIGVKACRPLARQKTPVEADPDPLLTTKRELP